MIYLDNAATTKPKKEIIDAFLAIENQYYANPSSIHSFGMKTNSYLEKARNVILNSFRLNNHQVIFTSSSTEACNLLIKGYCLSHQNRGKRIITSNIEHASVLECFNQLKEQFGFEVIILNVNKDGIIEKEQLELAMNDKTILVSIMAINNEVGSINPIEQLSKVVKQYPKCIFMVDTTQAIGKINLNYNDIDAFVISGHKIHGLKGSGCLILKKGISLLPLISGGGQENNLRSGTVSVSLAVSLAKAIQLANKDIEQKNNYVSSLKENLINQLKNIDGIVINSNQYCSPYIVNFSLINKKAAVIVEALSRKDIYISSVSACHSRKEKSSYVIKALTNDDLLAKNSIRISFSEENTTLEIDQFINELKDALERVKS